MHMVQHRSMTVNILCGNSTITHENEQGRKQRNHDLPGTDGG